VWRLRQHRPEPPWVVHHITRGPGRPSQAFPETPPAIGPAQEVHLHFHGTDPETIAQSLRRLDETH
jgi:hypothetical protein